MAASVASAAPEHDADYIHQKVRFFLTRYEKFYTEGDAESLAGLYATEARQQKLTGRDRIRDHYQRFFRLTEARELHFNLEDVAQQPEYTRVDAAYTGNLVYRGGRTENLSGSASFKIGRQGEQLSIREAAY